MAVTAAGFSFQQNGISDEMILAEAKTSTDIDSEDWEVSGPLPYFFTLVWKTYKFNLPFFFLNLIFVFVVRHYTFWFYLILKSD